MTGTTLDGMLLASTDPDRLQDWYVEALAPDEVSRVEQYRILRFGQFGLVIDQRSDIAVTNTDPARVILNFGIDDAKATVAQLEQMGVEWVAELEDRDGNLFATAKDPDGNYVQIIQMTPEARAQM